MTYEVELKFPLEDGTNEVDLEALFVHLDSLGASQHTRVKQRDTYFAHPSRDFAETDEALRIRCVDEQNCITYKGPIVDSLAKTRHEIEVEFATGHESAKDVSDILEHLGFTPVRTVVKMRTPYQLKWEGRDFEVVHDCVEGLGQFVEIEILADEDSRDAARDCLLRLANRLGLHQSNPKSYLCMLLEKD
jgi:adenylate cyclase class 2